jgi:hypothetical protein
MCFVCLEGGSTEGDGEEENKDKVSVERVWPGKTMRVKRGWNLKCS